MKWLGLLVFILLLGCAEEVKTTPANLTNTSDNTTEVQQVNVTNETKKPEPAEEVEQLDEVEEQMEEAVEETEGSGEQASQVRFWMATKSGAILDILAEGDAKVYVLGDNNYTVKVLFIGEGDDGLGEAMFQVNGERTKALARKETDFFQHKEFIYVRDVFYRD